LGSFSPRQIYLHINSVVNTKTIKRLVACFGDIQLVTVLSQFLAIESNSRELNVSMKIILLSPLFAPPGQGQEFAAFSLRKWPPFALGRKKLFMFL